MKYLITETFGDLKRVELFAREQHEGWDCWGNEVESNVNLETSANNGR